MNTQNVTPVTAQFLLFHNVFSLVGKNTLKLYQEWIYQALSKQFFSSENYDMTCAFAINFHKVAVLVITTVGVDQLSDTPTLQHNH